MIIILFLQARDLFGQYSYCINYLPLVRKLFIKIRYFLSELMISEKVRYSIIQFFLPQFLPLNVRHHKAKILTLRTNDAYFSLSQSNLMKDVFLLILDCINCSLKLQHFCWIHLLQHPLEILTDLDV